jgi:hypothetical protein
LLGTARSVNAFHEAEPKMNGEFIDMINAQPLEASREKRKVKVNAIVDLVRASGRKGIYAETNHTFIKTFYDVVLEEFQNVEVIVLRRALARVLKSFVELGYFTERNPNWPKWMSSPNAATAALPAIAPDEELDQFDRCIAYLIDIEARGERFKTEYANVPTHDVRLEDLNKIDNVEGLFARLGVRSTSATKKLVGQVVNEKQRRKSSVTNPTTLDECERRLAQYIAKARARGIKLPSGLTNVV